jgi:sulfite oxidase
VLLAWAMNGVPLPAVQGGPVRVVVPGCIGARSVKWVDRITVQHGPSDNYYQAIDYRLLPADADPKTARPGEGLSFGPLGLSSDILSPDDGAAVLPGPTTVTGYALADGDRGVARVDVSCDGGRSWRQAELQAPLSPWSWWLWSIEVQLAPGHHEITARA